MTDRQDLDRAMTLAEMAPNRSVRFEILAGREEGFSGSRLHDPPVTYLEGTEAPAYVLTNGKRGVGVGTKRNTTSPADERGTAILVTGRRTLCLVGQERSDEVIEVPHETVAEASYHTGLLGHRLALKTPRKQYHCWVSRSTDESVLARATEYVRERMPDAPYEDEPDGTETADFTYRGQPVTRENHPGLPDEPPEENAEATGTAADSGERDPGSDAATETSSGSGVDDSPQFTYRGQPVRRENHPGLSDRPASTAESSDDEAGAVAPSDGDGRSEDSDFDPPESKGDVDASGVRRGTHTRK